mmetsp:Transcript_4536/g.12033  ORF Transcript_4536/g.12033 Transcript_4536/m.12033 type:complete len:281 (-) Transcript_4536:154-996(-)
MLHEDLGDRRLPVERRVVQRCHPLAVDRVDDRTGLQNDSHRVLTARRHDEVEGRAAVLGGEVDLRPRLEQLADRHRPPIGRRHVQRREAAFHLRLHVRALPDQKRRDLVVRRDRRHVERRVALRTRHLKVLAPARLQRLLHLGQFARRHRVKKRAHRLDGSLERVAVLVNSAIGDLDQLDREYERLVRRDPAGALLAVRQVCRDEELPLVALCHQLQRLGPAWDDLFELEWHRLVFSAVRRVERLAVWPVLSRPPFVAAEHHRLLGRKHQSFALLDHLVL